MTYREKRLFGMRVGLVYGSRGDGFSHPLALCPMVWYNDSTAIRERRIPTKSTYFPAGVTVSDRRRTIHPSVSGADFCSGG